MALIRLLCWAQVTAYWLSHYPARIGHHMADRRCRSDIDLERTSRPVQPDKGGELRWTLGTVFSIRSNRPNLIATQSSSVST